jgi:hypothetical protein
MATVRGLLVGGQHVQVCIESLVTFDEGTGSTDGNGGRRFEIVFIGQKVQLPTRIDTGG